MKIIDYRYRKAVSFRDIKAGEVFIAGECYFIKAKAENGLAIRLDDGGIKYFDDNTPLCITNAEIDIFCDPEEA